MLREFGTALPAPGIQNQMLPQNSSARLPVGYEYQYMILTLAGWDYTKYTWVRDNCDVTDFIQYLCFKQFENNIRNEKNN
jgi:hypothetical protein